jgi:hypothetical protein
MRLTRTPQAKPLRLWNGQLPSFAPRAHAWAAAYSFEDLIRLLAEAGQDSKGLRNYLRMYWHYGSWGSRMDGIAPERAIWAQKDDHAPVVKLFPKLAVRRLARSRPA